FSAAHQPLVTITTAHTNTYPLSLHDALPIVSEEGDEPAEHIRGVYVVIDDQDPAAPSGVTDRWRMLGARGSRRDRSRIARRSRFAQLSGHGRNPYRERASSAETLAVSLDGAAVHLDE